MPKKVLLTKAQVKDLSALTTSQLAAKYGWTFGMSQYYRAMYNAHPVGKCVTPVSASLKHDLTTMPSAAIAKKHGFSIGHVAVLRKRLKIKAPFKRNKIVVTPAMLSDLKTMPCREWAVKYKCSIHTALAKHRACGIHTKVASSRVDKFLTPAIRVDLANMSVPELCIKYKLTPSKVLYYRHREGITFAGRRAKFDFRAHRDDLEALSMAEFAKKYERDIRSVYRYCRTLGIVKRHVNRSVAILKLISAQDVFKCKEDYTMIGSRIGGMLEEGQAYTWAYRQVYTLVRNGLVAFKVAGQRVKLVLTAKGKEKV